MSRTSTKAGLVRTSVFLFFLTVPVSQSLALPGNQWAQVAQMTPNSVLSLGPCGPGAGATHTIFANASPGSGGNGTYASPYHTLDQVENRLADDANITTVCLSGTFNEDLYLGDVLTNVLHVHSYGTEAIINAVGSSYAISNSSFGSYFSELSFHNLHVQGSSYAGFNLEAIGQLIISTVSVDATGASYGMMLSNNDIVSIDHVTIEGFDYAGITADYNDELSVADSTVDASAGNYGIMIDGGETVILDRLTIPHAGYAGISGDYTDDFSLTQSTIADTGSYAVMLDGCETATIKSNTFSEYTYSGVDIEADTAFLDQNKFYGSEGYNGMRVVSSDTGLITNNFVMDHDAAGADVGESDGGVRIINNSFSNNRTSVDANDGGPHALQVTLYNNIYSIPEEGMPYGPFWMECDDCEEVEAQIEDGDEEDGNMLSLYVSIMEEIGPSPSDNTELEIISDYNLFSMTPTFQNEGDEVTFAEWKLWGYDTHSLVGNPLFVSASNLHLRMNSPAIDVGINQNAYVTRDIDGQSRTGLYDIGADETIRMRTVKDVRLTKNKPSLKAKDALTPRGLFY